MTSEEQFYYDQELNKSRDELISTIVSLRIEVANLTNYKVSNTDALNAMHQEFMHYKKEADSLRLENKKLKEALTITAEKEQLRVKDIFGRGTERLSDLLSRSDCDEIVDEAETESETIIDFNTAVISSKRNGKHKPPHGVRSKNTKSMKVDLDSLPQRSRFLLDNDEFNKKYGKGGWRIAYWRKKRTVECPQITTYCLNTYTPVISVGLEHRLVSVPNPSILPGSFVSASFLAYIEYSRLYMSLPFYRLSESFNHMGLNISRQTLTNWFICFSETHFSLIYNKFHEMLMKIPYHQCDETFIRVNKDGRSAGTPSFMWVHRTSELFPCHPIILFCFELTRGTDHLRKFYSDFEGFITCDAYCAYRVLEKENADVIMICGCAMHLRRRFSESLALIDIKNLSEEVINSLPETIALKMIGKIYDADEKLKYIGATERKQARIMKVKPLVDEFYEFIEGLEQSPLMSNRLKDAIGYALNQKEYLCRFLEDGYIPIDDGASERAIRKFAISKRGSLFYDSINGAEAAAIMYSIMETARANKVNVLVYIRYLLEEISKHLNDTNLDFLETMMPWSTEYLTYERHCIDNPADTYIIGEAGVDLVLPKTPRKSDCKITSTTSNVA